jgi:hypothetical protein
MGTHPLRFASSRRDSSASMAFRMKSERFSPVASTASMRASVPARSRAGVCSSLIFFRPTRDGVGDITFSGKPSILLISPIAAKSDITYISDIRYGGNHMNAQTRTANWNGSRATRAACGGALNGYHAPKRKQEWAEGETVKVGFLMLEVVAWVEEDGRKVCRLWNPTNGKRYVFTPHLGLSSGWE